MVWEDLKRGFGLLININLVQIKGGGFNPLHSNLKKVKNIIKVNTYRAQIILLLDPG
jgi:hypothetical protein